MNDQITPMTILFLGTCAFMAAMYLLGCVLVALVRTLHERKRRKAPLAIGLMPAERPAKSQQQAATDSWRASQPLRANDNIYNPSRYDAHISRRLSHVPAELARRDGVWPADEK